MVNQESSAVDTIDVMIAEDSRIQAEMLRRRLVKEGFTARIAKNGAFKNGVLCCSNASAATASVSFQR